MMTFRDFQATRTRGDVSETYGDDTSPVTGFNYAGGSQIAFTDDSLGKYHLLIERFEWVSDDLEKLERILWANHSLESDFVLNESDLDIFIQGYCEARNKPIDGDFFSHVFTGSGIESIDVAGARDIVADALTHPMYEGNPHDDA